MIAKTLGCLALVLGVALASINIVAPASDSAYYLGEEVQVAGTFKPSADCAGSLELRVDSALTQTAKAGAKAGSVLKLEELFPMQAQLEKGKHSVQITGCNENATSDFKITDLLGISFSANTNRLMLNDFLIVNAAAYKKNRVLGLAKILIDNNEFGEHAEKQFTTPGTRVVEITAVDEYGNHGAENFSIIVSDKLFLLASANKAAYDPDETVVLNLEIRDAWNQTRNAKTRVLFDNKTKEQNINGYGTVTLSLSPDSAPGQRQAKIGANSNGNIAQQEISFFINSKKSFNYSTNVQGDELTVSVQNTGNTPLNNVTIKVCDDAGCKTNSTTLKVGEENKVPFKIIGKDAKVTLTDETGNKKSQKIATTGWATLSFQGLASVLAASAASLAYVFWRYKKQLKKRR